MVCLTCATLQMLKQLTIVNFFGKQQLFIQKFIFNIKCTNFNTKLLF